jgi:hypothetical protein
MTDERERLREALATVPRELIEPFVFCDATDKREPCNLPTCRNCTLRAALAHDRPGSVESIEPGNWLRFGPLTTEEIEAVVARLDSGYGLADMAGRYAQAWLDVARLLSTLAYNIGRAALSGSSDPEAQCLGYAGDPGASAPRCESYAGHPGRHFIRPFGSSDPEAVGLDRVTLARAIKVVFPHLGHRLVERVDAIAAEYARLTEAKPEPEAGS